MAYTKKYLIDKSLEAIKQNKLIFIDEIFSYVEFSAATFYNWKLEKLETIKKALADNKITMKAAMRKKWYDSDNPTLQIALMRLISNDAEFSRLVKTETNNTNKNVNIDLTPEQREEKIKQILDAINKKQVK
jgi:hypothetical protein